MSYLKIYPDYLAVLELITYRVLVETLINLLQGFSRAFARTSLRVRFIKIDRECNTPNFYCTQEIINIGYIHDKTQEFIVQIIVMRLVASNTTLSLSNMFYLSHTTFHSLHSLD